MRLTRRQAGAALVGALAAPAAAAAAQRSAAQRAASVFVRPPADPFRAPRVRRILLPDFPGAHAIWGATGRDDQGRIWAGVSADGGERSARLCRYDPANGRIAVMGDVLGNLRRLGLLRPGESQIKIHSRIVPADDGYLYFTSTDEDGEVDDGSAPPRWGSHMWRTRPDSDRWEHLLAVPEGLTCGAGYGRWIYALGLWDHVLYRYDTVSGAVGRVVVGSVGGHQSRNFVVDARGHAFVPRVRRVAGGLAAELVEFDPALVERAATPLANYAIGPEPGAAHGITGLVTLADGAIVIATSTGTLHRIGPAAAGEAAVVRPLGWFMPDGPAYVSGLDTWDGRRLIAGMAPDGVVGWHWVVRDLTGGTVRVRPLDTGIPGRVLLYGSQTADARGRFYVGGRYHDGPRLRPVLLQVDSFG
ncbi:MAG: hypothetical protein BGP12_02860 [Rhodospirillales bacterium 70-18]|nr:hypothetical protein [Rhodospirillales bacterium]OJY77484.1 MAG: hypothetical protein BGP12_02860 [Rhodospirillales bacterium 70-18]